MFSLFYSDQLDQTILSINLQLLKNNIADSPSVLHDIQITINSVCRCILLEHSALYQICIVATSAAT